MFAFVTSVDDQPEFVQTSSGHVYTYSSEKEARSYFDCVRHHASLYQLDADLGMGVQVESGDRGGPMTDEPTHAQRLAQYNTNPNKSQLFRKLFPGTFDLRYTHGVV